MYELMARKLPYTGENDHQINMAIWTKSREKLSETYSQNLRDLVDYCLNTNPDGRPNIE
jgi:serine/threonine protein kinase